DRIVVIDQGRIVAEGTPDALKQRVGGEVLEVTLAGLDHAPNALRATRHLAAADGRLEGVRLSLPVVATSGTAVRALRTLDAAGVEVVDLALRRPTLDDVFLALTGPPTSSEAA